MIKLSDFVREQKLKGLSEEERRKHIREETERKMAEVRERLRQREQALEVENIINEIFAVLPDELPAGTISCPLADEILNN